MSGSHIVKDRYSCMLDKAKLERRLFLQAFKFSACIFTSLNSLSLSIEVLAL